MSWDSDEEADPQGPTLVDSDDEPMVNVGRFTPWLHADSALSVAGTAIDSAKHMQSILWLFGMQCG